MFVRQTLKTDQECLTGKVTAGLPVSGHVDHGYLPGFHARRTAPRESRVNTKEDGCQKEGEAPVHGPVLGGYGLKRLTAAAVMAAAHTMQK